MTQANVLDTKECRDILQDMADSLPPRRMHLPPPRSASPPKVQVFAAAGIYTVVLAQNARDIPAALDQDPNRNGRPRTRRRSTWMPRGIPAGPLRSAVSTTGKHGSPTQCSGGIGRCRPINCSSPHWIARRVTSPDLDSLVKVDHVIAIGSHKMRGGERVRFSKPVPRSVALYVQHSIIGRKYLKAKLPNGDFVCLLNDVRRGVFQPARSRPPGSLAL
jgi:hypothetical protein